MAEKSLTVKMKVHALCLEQAEQQISSAQEAMKAIQLASNQETKSSAGDKYETGRAMMQLEQEKNARQLMEAMKLKKVLDQLNPAKECKEVSPGALIFTNNGNFYLSAGLGKFTMEGKEYMAISAVSPLGQQLKGLKAGQEAKVNGRNFKIEALF